MDKDELYKRLDEDEELTDSERREIYQAEIQADKDYEDWCDEYDGC